MLFCSENILAVACLEKTQKYVLFSFKLNYEKNQTNLEDKGLEWTLLRTFSLPKVRVRGEPRRVNTEGSPLTWPFVPALENLRLHKPFKKQFTFCIFTRKVQIQTFKFTYSTLKPICLQTKALKLALYNWLFSPNR